MHASREQVVYDYGDGKYNVSWPIATFPDATWPVDSVPYNISVTINNLEVPCLRCIDRSFDIAMHVCSTSVSDYLACSLT
jgi:hypothetical protein